MCLLVRSDDKFNRGYSVLFLPFVGKDELGEEGESAKREESVDGKSRQREHRPLLSHLHVQL